MRVLRNNRKKKVHVSVSLDPDIYEYASNYLDSVSAYLCKCLKNFMKSNEAKIEKAKLEAQKVVEEQTTSHNDYCVNQKKLHETDEFKKLDRVSQSIAMALHYKDISLLHPAISEDKKKEIAYQIQSLTSSQ